MPKVDFNSWLFDIRLAWKVFVIISFHKGVCIPSFAFQKFLNAIKCNISKLNGHLFCPPCHIMDLHAKSLFKKRVLVGFST